jgi:hypothetical protein
VCPQDKQCQAVCVVGRRHHPVGIGNLDVMQPTTKGPTDYLKYQP